MSPMNTHTRTRPHRHQHMRDIVPALLPDPVRYDVAVRVPKFNINVTEFNAGHPGVFKWTRRR